MSHDFDFYVGTWEVHNRRLDAPLTDSDKWDEFPGLSIARPIFGGTGNMDEIDFPSRGWSGLTLRLFDPQEQTWSLHWVSSRRTVIDPPVIGRFDNGRGEFFADDTHEGRPVRVRYIWSDMSATTAHWEQAFSVDDGLTWETNWTMDSRRTDI
jgi:hypothetical protein